MKKKKVDYLYYEVRFWYVKTLDLADVKYLIIYPLASFYLEIWPFKNTEKRLKKHLRPHLEDCTFITKIGMATIITYLISAKFEVFRYQK